MILEIMFPFMMGGACDKKHHLTWVNSQREEQINYILFQGKNFTLSFIIRREQLTQNLPKQVHSHIKIAPIVKFWADNDVFFLCVFFTFVFPCFVSGK